MKKLVLSAIMFLSVAGMAIAQDSTGTRSKSGSNKTMKDKKSGDWQKGKDSTMGGHQGGKAGKMKRDSTNH